MTKISFLAKVTFNDKSMKDIASALSSKKWNRKEIVTINKDLLREFPCKEVKLLVKSVS